MRLMSFTHNGKNIRDAQAALEFFTENNMGAISIWINISGMASGSREKHFDVHVSLRDVFAEFQVAFDTKEEALNYAANLPFDQPCNDQIGGQFYLRFIADPQSPA